jgi:hypothetical protein
MIQSLDAYAQQAVEFVSVHEAWAAPLAFALAFGESLVFVSLLTPAWAALIVIGALIRAGNLDFWPIWVAASIGAALGDWGWASRLAGQSHLSGRCHAGQSFCQPPKHSCAVGDWQQSSWGASLGRSAHLCRWSPASFACLTGGFRSQISVRRSFGLAYCSSLGTWLLWPWSGRGDERLPTDVN